MFRWFERLYVKKWWYASAYGAALNPVQKWFVKLYTKRRLREIAIKYQKGGST